MKNNMSSKQYLLKDQSSGSETKLPARSGTMGPDVFDIRTLYAEQDAFTYDPGFASTASCESKITFIDGAKGVLPVPRLSGKATC